MAEHLLSDAQMRDFIVNGFVTVTTQLPAQFHDAIYEKTVEVFDKEGNPGNNLLPRIPEIQQIFDDQNVSGALTSLLGPDYYMQPHRHPHYNPPGSKGQGLHQDGGKRWSSPYAQATGFLVPARHTRCPRSDWCGTDKATTTVPAKARKFRRNNLSLVKRARSRSRTTTCGTVRCRIAVKSDAT